MALSGAAQRNQYDRLLDRAVHIREIAEAGADTFVAGSAIFGSGNFEATIATMRSELELAKVTEYVR